MQSFSETQMTVQNDRVVLCMRWGNEFPPAYVNVLHNACKKAITGSFRFVCLTDDPSGIDQSIETYPIPDIRCRPAHWHSGAWPKLSVFRRDLYGLAGRALFIDLDTLVVGNIDSLFKKNGDFIAVGGGKNWRRGKINSNPTANTSVFAFTLGEQSQIQESFTSDPDKAVHDYINEQDFAQKHATSWRPWPNEWVVSYKRHLRAPIFVDRMIKPSKPSDDVKIVAFHGSPRPLDVVVSGKYNYEKFPRYGKGPISWVREYWLENGWEEDEQ